MRKPGIVGGERADWDGFVPLPENRLALDAVQGLVDSESTVPVLLHGPPGSGKSHLVAALANAQVRRRPDASVQVIPAAEAVFDDVDLLAIEDLQHLPARAANGCAECWDRRLTEGQATVCTANTGPAALDLPARLANRLAGGLVVGLTALSGASRRTLLHAKVRQRQLPVEAGILDWLAERLTGNGRAIEGTVQQLEQLARTGKRLTFDLIQELWGGQESDRPLERIARRVAGHFGMDAGKLASPRRGRGLLLPRQLGMYLARRLTRLSLGEIGQYFGRDHTTVLHACRKIDQAIGQDLVLAGTVRQLTADLA